MVKNWITVKNRETEKELYRIMKELEWNGKSVIDKQNCDNWDGVMRKFGIRAAPLVDNELLEPVLQPDIRKRELNTKRYIYTKDNVKIEEVSMGNLSRFYFKKIEMPAQQDIIHKKRRRLI